MRAIVCGAGIAGLTTASSLASDGWQVVLIEKAPHLREEGYMIDFFGPGYTVVERMGLLPRLQELAYTIREAVWADEKGRRQASLDYEIFRQAEHGRAISLMRGDLERTLYEALPPRVEQRFSCGPAAVRAHEDGVIVELDSGECIWGDLLVGADGIHSQVRSLVFGPEETFFHYLAYHTAAFVFDDAEVEAALGNRVWMMSVPGREVGLYAIRGGRVAAFFIHASTNPERPENPVAELRHVYGDLNWLVPAALAGAERARSVYYDQVAQIALDEWCRGRVALVGDAAYAVSLLAGQGASLAVAGAYTLAASLRRSGSVEYGLSTYRSRLKEVVEEKQAAGRRAAQWIAPLDRRHILLRNWSLKLAKIPGMSRIIARSLTGEEDRLMT